MFNAYTSGLRKNEEKKARDKKSTSWTGNNSILLRSEVIRDVPLCIVSRPRMFCFLKGVLAPSLERREVRGVSAGEITSQAELMAPDREERG